MRWVPENAFRPFCSARCKQMDLGAWGAERYRISGTDELLSNLVYERSAA
ncbi:MAG: DNA gyrase inhibitor YacG [Burkholderia sp.]